MIDKKGDTLEYPKVVHALPFWDSANTYFFNDDYTVSCPGDYIDQGGGKVPILALPSFRLLNYFDMFWRLSAEATLHLLFVTLACSVPWNLHKEALCGRIASQHVARLISLWKH